jgi:2-hydroxy-6-oxo-6-(2'-aminophenyl)hexa-2,4-dienoate hydrolase
MVGFGGTDCPDPATTTYSQDARNEHLVAFLDAMGFDKACLVGNSMGGGTSLGVAMSAPHRVRRLVLMGSAGLSKGPPSPELRTIVEYREPSLDGMRAIVRALTNPQFAVDEELVRYRYGLTLDEARMASYRAIQEWSKEAGGLWYEEDAIAAVEVPTLIVHGRLDQVVGVEQAYRFGELLANSWLYVIPHCGHWAMLERPDDFATITERFLTRDW